VLLDHVKSCCELHEDGVLGLDPVPLRQAGLAEFDRYDRYDRGRPGVLRQDRAKNRGTGRVTLRHLEGELRYLGADALGARALPLRPHQPQRGVILRAGVVRVHLVASLLATAVFRAARAMPTLAASQYS
jgi:hypothetical protein